MTGDVTDMRARLRALLPPWFPAPGSAIALDAALTGIATLLAGAYGVIAYAQQQIRLLSASGPFIDLFAYDYLGTLLRRYPDDTDASFAARVFAFLLMPRIVRSGIRKMLTTLTGRPPGILALWNPQDCGGWSDGKIGSIMGWSTAGCWGEIVPNQLTIVAYRPFGVPGVPNQGGWAPSDPIYKGNTLFGPPGQFALGQMQTTDFPMPGAWDDGTGTTGGALSWINPAAVSGDVTDFLIERFVAQWVAAGVNYSLFISS